MGYEDALPACGKRFPPQRAEVMSGGPWCGPGRVRHRWLLLGLGAVLVGAVVYFSWIPDPSFRHLSWMPRWLRRWADRNVNGRTAVPMLLLGMTLGWLLHGARVAGGRMWGGCFGGLCGLVVLVELGQLFLPQRTCDWRDVAWGAAGSAAGLGPWWMARLKIPQCGTENAVKTNEDEVGF